MGLLFDNTSNSPISTANPMPVQIIGGGASSGNTSVTSIPQDGTIPAGAPFSGAVNGAILFTVDTTGYESITTQLYGTFSATVSYEVSNDNTNWLAVQGNNLTNLAGIVIASVDNAPVIRAFPVQAKFFRVRISAYTSGTVNIVPILRSASIDYGSTYVQGGTVTLAAGSANIGIVGGMNVTAVSGALGFPVRMASSTGALQSGTAKGSAGRLYKVTAFNASTSVRWLKFHNIVAAPVVGTTAVVFAVPIPVGYFELNFADLGQYFTSGIGWSLTAGAPDNDVTVPAAGDILNLTMWVA
jgi:hypothetical protein